MLRFYDYDEQVEPDEDLGIALVAVSSAVLSASSVEPSAVVLWSNARWGSGVQVWGVGASAAPPLVPVRCHTTSYGDTYALPRWQWPVVPDGHDNARTYRLDALAVSPWVHSGATLTMAIAAVVRTTTVLTGAASLTVHAVFPYVSSIAVTQTAGLFPLPTYADLSGTEAALSLGVGAPPVVGMAHIQSWTPPSAGTTPPPLHGAFLVAYNTVEQATSPCGGTFVGATAAGLSVLSNVQLCSGASAGGVTYSGGLRSVATSNADALAPVLYLLFVDAPNTVFSARIVTDASNGLTVVNLAEYASLQAGSSLSSIVAVPYASQVSTLGSPLAHPCSIHGSHLV